MTREEISSKFIKLQCAAYSARKNVRVVQATHGVGSDEAKAAEAAARAARKECTAFLPTYHSAMEAK